MFRLIGTATVVTTLACSAMPAADGGVPGDAGNSALDAGTRDAGYPDVRVVEAVVPFNCDDDVATALGCEDGVVFYVSAAASGGDGSAGAPFGTLAEGIAGCEGAACQLRLERGRHELRESADEIALMLRGRCTIFSGGWVRDSVGAWGRDGESATTLDVVVDSRFGPDITAIRAVQNVGLENVEIVGRVGTGLSTSGTAFLRDVRIQSWGSGMNLIWGAGPALVCRSQIVGAMGGVGVGPEARDVAIFESSIGSSHDAVTFVSDSSRLVIRNSDLTGNRGVYISHGARDLLVEGTTIASREAALFAAGGIGFAIIRSSLLRTCSLFPVRDFPRGIFIHVEEDVVVECPE